MSHKNLFEGPEGMRNMMKVIEDDQDSSLYNLMMSFAEELKQRGPDENYGTGRNARLAANVSNNIGAELEFKLLQYRSKNN